MKRLTIIALLLTLSGYAMASDDYRDDPDPPDNGDQIDQQEQNQDQAQSAEASQSQTAEGGAGGSGYGGDGGAGGNGAGGNSTTTVRNDYKRAPGIAMGSPRSTADDMKCIGLGASAEDGSALVGWCWLQRDSFALRRFVRLSELGLFLPAANAYCSQKLMAADFDDEDACKAAIAQSLTSASLGVEGDLPPK